MFHIILDTNILDRSPNRNNPQFRTLQELCDSGKVQIHLSDVVQREFLAHRNEAIEEGVEFIIRGFKKLGKEKVTKHPQFSEFLSWENRLEELKSQLVSESYDEFMRWVESLNIQVHKVAPHHGEATINAYFEGNAPFRGNRSKAEFADAFIWQSLLDILRKNKNVHLVTNNKKDFSRLCDETPGVTLYTSLDEFLISPPIKSLFFDQFVEQNFQIIIDILRQKEVDILPIIIDKVSTAFDMVDDSELGSLVESGSHISGWGYSAEKDWIGKLEYKESRHYGYGNVSIPIVVRINKFDMDYSKSLRDTSRPLPSNIEMHSLLKSGEPSTLFTRDYFALLLYAQVDFYLPTDNGDNLTLEDVPNLINQARIIVNQIDYIEADETNRKKYYEII